MITFLEGILEEKTPTQVVMNVGGIGYEVLIPLSSYDRLPMEGESCRILIHDHVREDAHVLFGFTDADQRGFFLSMLGISGIGPKLALGALSGLPVREFKRAVLEGDVKRISSISGIGKKTAERIIIELKDKISEGEALELIHGEKTTLNIQSQDAAKALTSLGYPKETAVKMVLDAEKRAGADVTLEELVRLSLKGK